MGEPSLRGHLKLLRGSSELHRAYLRPIVLGKESISDFFPVPPAHHRVTKCDTAREKLLGIIGDLFEVSLALEENIVPEYPDPAEPSRIVHINFREYIFGTFHSVWSIRNRLQAAKKEVV